jgi:SulP family sulfate permease
MRTLVNVQAGGKTSLSGIIHSLILLIIVLGASSLTSVIPHAVLAGLLLKVGIDIIDWDFIKRAHQLSAKSAVLMYLVMFLTVFVDLITAVIVGSLIANSFTIKLAADAQSDRLNLIIDPNQAHNLNPQEQLLLAQSDGNILLFQLAGSLNFAVAKAISQKMAIAPDYKALLLDLTEVSTIGVTVALAIESIVIDAVQGDRQVWIVTSKAQVHNRIKQLQLHRFSQVHFTGDRLQALQSLAQGFDLRYDGAED